MSEMMPHAETAEFTFDLDDPTHYVNSENPPYNAYLQYLGSIEAAFTKAEISDILKEPETDLEMDLLVDGFRVR